MHPLESYLSDIGEIHRTGQAVEETSYYPAIEALLSAVGQSLKPRVKCVMNLRNRGAGMPDGGLFTADQFRRRRGAVDDPLEGLIPSRGAIEAKGPRPDAHGIARGAQVGRYLERYRQVLVTNLREFVLVGFGADGERRELESFALAASERDLWRLTHNPRAAVETHGDRFVEYLRRVLLHAAPLAAPQDLAWFLASYARDARARIEGNHDVDALGAVRVALEEALGLRFEGERGDRFFRSTLVQTLFYGVFSAWVLWSRRHPTGDRVSRFNWREASWTLRVPMIRVLYEQIATPTHLGPLGLVELLDWAADTLNRVDRAQFFTRFEEEHAVQYFYEPFLQAFDPELRKELGVWYTPREVVQYMVSRVDTVLRDELGLPEGLADENVYVLDPCCGTGAYLVEVIKRIDTTLRARGTDALHAADLKAAALKRVFGFEILPAPFVVAHLQLGLLLQRLGAPLAGTLPEQLVRERPEERVNVYLTNALTGWEARDDEHQRPIFPEMEAERNLADRVKREAPILVILGNPPYNGFAGVAVEEERDLVEAYRRTTRAPAPQGQGLNDLFVRFFRMAERRIVEQTGEGVVCFISNYSWLDGLSFTGMRERYLEVFDKIWIDNLHGDKYRTGKLTPEGEPDPSVFSTESNREGIQVGTAIALMVRREPHESADHVEYQDWRGQQKLASLAAAQLRDFAFADVVPRLSLGLPFAPTTVSIHHSAWPSLPDLFPAFFPGVKTSRDELLVDIGRQRLVERMQAYFDPDVTQEELRAIAPSALHHTRTFDGPRTREALQRRGFHDQQVVRYTYRPFDRRWLYWESESHLIDRPRVDYVQHVHPQNIWMEARQKQPTDVFDRGYVTRDLADNFGNGLSSFFPLILSATQTHGSLFEGSRPNLSLHAERYVAELGANPRALFAHAIAIQHSPAYRVENAGGLRHDWPRIPLPAATHLLHSGTQLGEALIALFDPDARVSRPRWQVSLASVTRTRAGSLDPNADLAITAGWGSAGKNGVTMPGRGKLVGRAYEPEERVALVDAATANGLTPEQVIAILGETTIDVHLNDVAYWRNIPRNVWEYTLSGYQVIKKWLSYREEPILGRPLTVEEVREVSDIARRIAAILLMGPALDANYEAVKAEPYPWPATPA